MQKIDYILKDKDISENMFLIIFVKLVFFAQKLALCQIQQ